MAVEQGELADEDGAERPAGGVREPLGRDLGVNARDALGLLA